MADLDAYDWLRPKLHELLQAAAAAGIAKDVSVAVITDLVNGPEFSVGPLETDEDWNKDIGEPDGAAAGPVGPGVEAPESSDMANWPANSLRNVPHRSTGHF